MFSVTNVKYGASQIKQRQEEGVAGFSLCRNSALYEFFELNISPNILHNYMQKNRKKCKQPNIPVVKTKKDSK